MLKNIEALTTMPVTDLERAKAFYENLGLKTKIENDMMLTMEVEGGPSIVLYKREDPTKADHTVLTFEVEDIENEVLELEKRGIIFEDYHREDLETDEHHICTMGNDRAAWFKDSEGNILGIHEELKERE